MQYIVPIIPYDYAALQRVIREIRQRYPFLRTQIFGKSVCGRCLTALTLGSGNDCVLFAAAFHGQEWITSYIALKFLSRLCHMEENNMHWRAKAVSKILMSRRVVIIPTINPDGVNIALHGAESAGSYALCVNKVSGGSLHDWNANARGVDLNHNFNAGWYTLREIERGAGVCSPSPRRYGGAYPESEPETRALTNLTMCENPNRVFAMHSQGEEIYWEYGGIKPDGAKRLALSLAAESGYKLIKNSGLASHGGYKDWFIKEFCRPGFTLEFGKGQNPLPLRHFESIYEKAEDMLLLAALG